MEETLLEIKDIQKSFGTIKALNGPSFRIKKGQCFGLLGPNGAGKSTLIEIIERVQDQDSGEILFMGKKPGADYLKDLGVQFQSTSLPAKLNVKESLALFHSLYQSKLSLDEVIDRCQIRDFLLQGHDKISGGQRQRLLLAIALCHDPKLIILDEPTTGLDPQARRHLWQVVKDILKKGKTVLLTTHYMDEAYELCDELAIMDHGKIIASGSPDELLETFFKKAVIDLPLSEIKKVKDKDYVILPKELRFELHTEKLEETLKELLSLGVSLESLIVRRSNLEDLFIELTGKEIRT